MEKLKGSQRRRLRALAHSLKPVVMIGRNGLNEKLTAAISAALNDHELIKVKFLEFKEEKKDLAEEIAGVTRSELVGIIGNIAMLYRQQPDPQKRKIKI